MKRLYGIVIMLVVAGLVLVLDQVTKAWVMTNMEPREIRPIINGVVQLHYTQNSGAAFGIFQGWTGALSVAAIAIIVAIVLSASKVSGGNLGLMLGMGLVLGGAIGNLIDRLRLGYVADFVEANILHVNITDTVYTFPVFNAADSAITVGVILVLAVLIFGKHEPLPARATVGRQRRALDDRSSPIIRRSAVNPWSPSPGTQYLSPVKEPTFAGWAGLFAVVAGFLLMALRSAARER